MSIAIQVKFIDRTNHYPRRWVAVSKAGRLVVDANTHTEDQAVQKHIEKFLGADGVDVEVSGVGLLPNGDYVATIRRIVGKIIGE